MKNITFTLADQSFSDWSLPPYPAIENLPEWYKTTPQFFDNKRYGFFSGRFSNKTLKKCTPLTEAISMGYYIPLSSDLAVHDNNSELKITWGTRTQIVDEQIEFQIGNFTPPDGYESRMFKFHNNYKIQTPKGYSTLFMTPLMRPELNFFCFPGVVDTDVYPLPINFPFILKKDFTGIINRGTPIIQAIPFKRDRWKPVLNKDFMKNFFQLSELRSSQMNNFYKKNYWSRKEWR